LTLEDLQEIQVLFQLSAWAPNDQDEGATMNKLYIVLDQDKPAIREYPIGTRPSNFLSMAPRGVKLGDEHLLSWDAKTRRLHVHWDRQVKGAKKSKEIHRKNEKAVAWNSKSLKERVLSSFLKT
jgi:hypothetical protein